MAQPFDLLVIIYVIKYFIQRVNRKLKNRQLTLLLFSLPYLEFSYFSLKAFWKYSASPSKKLSAKFIFSTFTY